MDSKEKLRQEIAQLTHLIASSKNGGTASTSTFSPIYSPTKTATFVVPRSRPYHLNRSLSVVNTQNVRSAHSIPQYPNPFRYSVMGNYSEQVFPNPNPSEKFSSSSRNFETTSYSNSRRPSPYKIVRKNYRDGRHYEAPSTSTSSSSVYKSRTFNSTTFASTASDITTAPAPNKSIYINPSHFMKSTQESGAPSSVYINPAFARNAGLLNNVLPSASALSGVSETVTASQHSGEQWQQTSVSTASSMSNSNGPIVSATTVKSKYKLDRRVKRSPTRAKLPLVKHVFRPSTSKRKVTNQYSMKWVTSRPILTAFTPMSSSFYHSRKRKSIALAHKHLYKSFTRKSLKSCRSPVSRKGSKSVVNISGSKFVSNNGGRTLKRVKSKTSPSLVCIRGKQFIQKNGGKSLKRLTDTPRSRLSSQSHNHTLSQTPGVRFATRAVAKSKLTLSQRTWRKKRFCVFYNRFGECKNNESGNCPYVHDRKQLTICPKFVVGKCTNSECKLSHDLKLGRMMPCRFFNKSKCSRENCPYPHVKATPVIKKSTKASKDSELKSTAKKTTATSSTPRKRLLSSSNSQKSSQKKKKRSKVKDSAEVKARYYDEKLDSQPMVSIVPRRLPMELAATGSGSVSKAANENIVQSCNNSGEKVNVKAEVKEEPSPRGGLRSRLMKRVSALRKKVEKKESTAPTFLSFKVDDCK